MIWRTHWLGWAAAGALAAMSLAVAGCGSAGHPAAASSGARPAPGATAASVAVKPDPKLHALLPASVRSAGVLRVATNIPYPPWEMYTTAGGNQPTGVDYDLSRALAARLGLRVSFDQTSFDSIIPSLQADKEDVVMAGMWDTKQREGALKFVDYATDGYGLLVRAGNPEDISSPDSLSGKTVAVQSGTTQISVLGTLNAQLKAAGKSPVTVLQFSQDSDTLLAVQSGKADAQFDGLSVAAYTAKTSGEGNEFQLIDNASLNRAFGTGVVGIGVPENDPALVGVLRQALQSLIGGGDYAKILDRYGLGRLAQPSATVDAGGR